MSSADTQESRVVPEDDGRRITLEMEGAVARLRLVRAPRNGIDLAFTEQLEAAVAALTADPGPARVVLITAEGRDFSVGGDLGFLTEAGDGIGPLLDRMIGNYHRSLEAIAALPLPVVCGAQGSIAGGGLGLLWASDVVLVAHDARFVLAFAGVGLSGDGGSSWYLPRMIGLHRALDLVINGRVLAAAEAADLGLCTSVVLAADLEDEALMVAQRLATGPTAAYGQMRRLYRTSGGRDVGAQLAEEQRTIVALSEAPDGREGVNAFAERRRPDFQGR